MKKKDIIYLFIAVAILLVAGYLAYTQVVAPKSKSAKQDVKVEVVGTIKPTLNEAALNSITNGAVSRDYSVDIDITSDVNNAAVFGK